MRTIKITIDTEAKKIIVPDTFFKQIDKMNEAIKMGGGKEVDYVDFIKSQFEEAIASPVARKSDK